MPEPRTESRPSQVTVLSGFAILTSFLLVIAAYDSLGQIASVDMRHKTESYLGTGGGSGLTISVDRAIQTMHVLTLIAGGLAAAAFVLAIYVLRRHNGARVALTAVSALLLLDFLALARMNAAGEMGILPLALAGVSVMLWSPRVRDWFGGTGGSTAPAAPVARVSDPRTQPPPEPSPDGSVPAAPQPPPPPRPASVPYGQLPPPSARLGQAPPPAPGAPSYPYPPPGPPQPLHNPGGHVPPPGSGRPRRPGSVLAAAVITWVSAGLAFLGSIPMMVMVFGARSELVDQIESNPAMMEQLKSSGLSDVNAVVDLVAVIAVIIPLWSLAAIALAVFAFRGANWARLLLATSAGAVGSLALIGVLSLLVVPGSPAADAMVLLLFVAATVTATVLLFMPTSNRFFGSRPGGGNRPVW